MLKKYSGITVPAPTPVNPDETVNEEGYRALIEFMIENGVDGVFACGTLGETMQLTQAERNRAIRIAADQAKGRIKIFGGVMDTSTKRVIENVKAIEESGADAVVLTPVFYDRHTSQGEIIRLFEDVSKETRLDLVAYNIPTFVIEKIEPATVVELSKIDGVKCYKDSGANFNETVKVLDQLKDNPDFTVLSGTPVQYIPSAFAGADGCVPSMASLYPRMFAEANKACQAKDYEKMLKYHHFILEAGKIYGAAKNGTAAVKYAASLLGFFDPRIIRPADGISDAEAEKIKAQKEKCDALFKEAGCDSKL